MISRSTTPDLIKMATKLDEFFTQQLTSSKRVLSAFTPVMGGASAGAGGKAKLRRKDSEEANSSWISEIR